MRNYTLKQIQTFIAVARHKSVSKAAEQLFVTQPAVSMQLRQLEDAFGLPLVETVGRNIALTGAGQEFLTHAIAAIAQLKDLEALMAEHVGVRKGRFELAVVSTAKYFVPMLLVQFAKLHPGIEVTLRVDRAPTDQSQRVADVLCRGTCTTRFSFGARSGAVRT